MHLVGGGPVRAKLEFKSGGKVELSFMGAIQEGSFVVEDQRVKITNAGSTQIFRIDDKGCLDAGAILGRYCKQWRRRSCLRRKRGLTVGGRRASSRREDPR